MAHMIITQSDVIPAPVDRVYGVIADYQHAHNAILPRPYFQSMTVLQGGYGAGTEIKVDMNVFGVEKQYHQRVSEIEPGRKIVERDIHTGLATTFTLVPVEDAQTLATIHAEIALSAGVRGWLEWTFNPFIIGHIFKVELQNLAAYLAHTEPVRV